MKVTPVKLTLEKVILRGMETKHGANMGTDVFLRLGRVKPGELALLHHLLESGPTIGFTIVIERGEEI